MWHVWVTLLLVLLDLAGATGIAGGDVWSYNPSAAPGGVPREYEGISMNFLFPDFIAHGLNGNGTFFTERIAAFCETHGTSATMTGKQFPGAYRLELDTDLGSTNLFDVFNFFGSWMPSLAREGKLLKLTDYVRSSPDIAWSDILPRVRKGVAEYQNEIYMLPADGDVIVMIYRKDLLDYHGLARPETWEDFLAVSNYFRTQVGPDAWQEENRTLDMEGGMGACVMTKRNDWAYADLFAYLSTWLQAHGPEQGVFFTPDTFEPLFNTSAAREALALWKQIVTNSSHMEHPCTDCSGSVGSGLESMVSDMQAGKCMMGLNYMGPVKFIAGGAFNTENSTIALAPVPGSRRVKQLDGDELVDCNDARTNCPYAERVPKNVDGRPSPMGETQLINRATYFSGGGQSWAVGNFISDSRKREAIWKFLKSLIIGSNAIDSTTAPNYLLDPFRQSTLDALQVRGANATVEFMSNGWKWDQLGTMKDTLNYVFNDPNGVLDLKIVGGNDYIEATDRFLLEYYVGNTTLDEAIEGLVADWESRTLLMGKALQRNLYRSVLGLPQIQLDCPAGQESVTGTCQDCPVGKFKATNSSELCQRCPSGEYQSAPAATTCSKCEDVLANSTTRYIGADNDKACECPPNYFWYKELPDVNATAVCRQCGVLGTKTEGLHCEGLGNGTHHTAPMQAARYSAAAQEFEGAMPEWVVLCSNKERCPGAAGARDNPELGALLGTCPPNARGRACNDCMEKTYRDGDSCTTCEDAGSAFAWIMLFLGGIFAFVALYFFGTRQSSAHMSSGMTVMLTCGLSVAAVQALGAFSKLSIEWVEPIKSLNLVLNLFVFNVDLVRPSCIFGPQSPAFSYLSSVLVYPVFAVSLRLVFWLAGILQERIIHRHQIVNSQGLVLMAAYLSLTMVAVLPWQCESNPDGSQSVVAYRGVECWVTSEHHIMIVLSLFATFGYVVSFMTLVTWAILQYPTRIAREGGMEFVREFHFLFARFTSQRYYYSLIFLVRNMLLALLPVMLVNSAQVQLLLMCLVISTTGMLQSHFWPWRTEVANYVDAALSIALCLILVAGALLIDLSDGTGQEVVQISMIVIGIVASVCLLTIIAINVFYALRPPKRYGIFLSHHKVGAAVLARWFKMLLTRRTSDRVFLDSDDVSDLDNIIDTVAHDTKNLMVLLTRETLERMWCAGEIATAHRTGVNIVLVQCDDYPGLTDEFLKRLPHIWTDSQKTLLASAGLEIEHIQETYASLKERATIQLGRFIPTYQQEAVVKLAFKECKGCRVRLKEGLVACVAGSFTGNQAEKLTEQERKHAEIQVLGSHKEPEAACICRVLKVYLQAELQCGVTLAIDGDVSALSAANFQSTRFLLVVLTRGVLENADFAKVLTWASLTDGLQMDPVRADEAFVYPDPSFYTDLQNGRILSESATRATAKEVESAYKRLFNTLAQRFTTHASQTIQEAEVKMIARHLRIADAGARSEDVTPSHAGADEVAVYLTETEEEEEAAKEALSLNVARTCLRDVPTDGPGASMAVLRVTC